MSGIIIKALSGFYYVSDGERTFECRARGSFRKSGVSPLVGDKVEFTVSADGKGVVEQVFPRKNELSRPPVANIDKLYIVSSFENPAPNTYIIDKSAALAEYRGIEPVIVFNKRDMGDFDDLEQLYRRAGFSVFTVSALNGEGMDLLCSSLKGSVGAFSGNSGVGKSSILNFLFGSEKLATGEVSQKLGRGRHTTRHTELYPLPFGGYAADTPGFSSVDYYIGDYKFKENLICNFRDLKEYAGECRFTSCTHTSEKGCALREALKKGIIEQSRYASYVALFEELKDLRPWNTVKNK